VSPDQSVQPRRLVVGVSGSSAPQLAAMFLESTAKLPEIETHLVMSAGARVTLKLEMGVEPEELERNADHVYDPRDMGAAVSSGSFVTMGMVVIPCSMKTLAGVATGNYDNLVGRAADVTLKERRPLVLVTRETPLNLVHIKNMETATLAGATVLPPVPAFYHRPETIDDLLRHTCGKVLDQFGIEHDLYRRWTGH
jgi:polyprenyl P-hydroxybenzoate/phenylacrylic acid decarboxylase-like protein